MSTINIFVECLLYISKIEGLENAPKTKLNHVFLHFKLLREDRETKSLFGQLITAVFELSVFFVQRNEGTEVSAFL
jgi:hypothetical protein